ncbi:MAG: phosphoribosyl-ATP diphosphatase [Treponema sp.]|jgi:phosphoribosyl-ATP pyrophosphohydrolase/phosphoribosyl-AMP cyclohydrolase|nr:phosphoribosyl-ATP diphosphatase [Treponema sp.]
MVIASIDIQGGKVVQLKQGSELVLQRDNAEELVVEFDRYGEVAVIDLDAAMNKGSNLGIVKSLLRKAECRVGGGIRTVKQARELLSMGAKKIIIGSTAFRVNGRFGVNTEFLSSMANEIGREHIIVAVDAKKDQSGAYRITIDGWRTQTQLTLVETAKAVEPFASELLFTSVDREGTMTGLDLVPVKSLRAQVSCNITIAGGVSTVEEIATLAELNCDVQLGMALYTGKVNLADAFVRCLNWGKGFLNPADFSADVEHIPSSLLKEEKPLNFVYHSALMRHPRMLLPVIAQTPDGQVLMTGFTDREALAETFACGNLCFHSRTRNKLWMKGESSGSFLKLLRLRSDCDRDALLAIVKPAGPVCHTGAWSCFGVNRDYTWEGLQTILADRLLHPTPGSYTATLDDDLVREKVREEAEEVCMAKTHGEVVWEAADLLYFTTVLMTREGVSVTEVLAELERRHRK